MPRQPAAVLTTRQRTLKISSEFLVGIMTTPTNYATFLPIMLRIMLITSITYYAGSSARIIAASLIPYS